MKKTTELRQAICGLFLLALVVGIVALNDGVLGKQRESFISARNDRSPLEKLNRAIASAQPKEAFTDVNEEHALGEMLTEKRDPASFGRAPSAVDRTIYKVFSQNYAVVREKVDGQNKVLELRFEDNMESPTRPMNISNVTEFLEKYKKVWAISFKKPIPNSKQEDPTQGLASYTYNLKNEKNVTVGTAEITIKAGGLTHLQFHREASIPD